MRAGGHCSSHPTKWACHCSIGHAIEAARLEGSGRWCETINLVCLALFSHQSNSRVTCMLAMHIADHMALSGSLSTLCIVLMKTKHSSGKICPLMHQYHTWGTQVNWVKYMSACKKLVGSSFVFFQHLITSWSQKFRRWKTQLHTSLHSYTALTKTGGRKVLGMRLYSQDGRHVQPTYNNTV